MSYHFDPLHRLITEESIRFIGTVSDVLSNAPAVYCTILEGFVGREVRNGPELISAIQQSSHTKENLSKEVAVHTLEVADALRFVGTVTIGKAGPKKYMIAEHGRMLNALRSHPGFQNESLRATAFVRPMFEANGDYLLQAMAAFESGPNDRPAVLRRFRDFVTAMANAKVDELRNLGSGLKWTTYRKGVEARRNSILGLEENGLDARRDLAAIQKIRAAARDATLEQLKHRAATGAGSVSRPRRSNPKLPSSGETKTLEHQFARCRAWLQALSLVTTDDNSPSLTSAGIRLLNYFRTVTSQRSPVRIPPSAALLEDCFRITPNEIVDIWGVYVDDEFWESALIALATDGIYQPSRNEIEVRFDAYFTAVKVGQISEAMIAPLRHSLFLSWLWQGKCVAPREMSNIFFGELSIPRLYPNRYGYGRNRQGRLVYLFRKEPR